MTTGDRLFLRRWSITIGSGQSRGSSSSGSTNNQSALTSGNVDGSAAVDIKFKIKRTLQAKPHTLELDVFNLTEDHRNTIKSATRPIVQVSAGYKDTGVSMLFNGIGGHARVFRDGPDVITRLRAGDGVVAYRTARVNQSFAANANLNDVITALASAMGVGLGNVSTALQNVTLDQLGSTFVHGTVLRGLASAEMNALLRSANMDWSIQEGVLQVLPRLAALQRQAITLSSDTGLLDVPEVGNHGTLTLKALIQPGLVPGQIVSVSSDQIDGNYRIEDAEWSGDTIGNDWHVELTCRPYTTTVAGSS